MNAQELVDYLIKGISEGKIDPEMPIGLYDGVTAFSSLTSEGMQVVQVTQEEDLNDNPKAEVISLLCLNADQLPNGKEVVLSSNLHEVVEDGRVWLNQLAGCINVALPQKDNFSVESIFGLAVFNAQKAAVLGHINSLDDSMRNLVGFIDAAKADFDKHIAEENDPDRIKAEAEMYERQSGAVVSNTIDFKPEHTKQSA